MLELIVVELHMHSNSSIIWILGIYNFLLSPKMKQERMTKSLETLRTKQFIFDQLPCFTNVIFKQQNGSWRTICAVLINLMNMFIRQKVEDRQDNYKLQTEIKQFMLLEFIAELYTMSK